MKKGKSKKGAFMKNGLIGLSVLVALLLCGNQNGFAASNITLNLNATGLSTINTLYTVSSSKIVATALGWTEKVLYNMDGTVGASVTNTTAGHVIVRLDVICTNTTSGAITANSYWLKRGKTLSPFGGDMSNIQLVAAGDTAYDLTSATPSAYGTEVNPLILTSLYLNEDSETDGGTPTVFSAGTITQLISFAASSMQLPAQIIFTAVLVDSTGQITGVDIKSMFFNWVGSATTIKAGNALPSGTTSADLGGIFWGLAGYANEQQLN